MLNIFLSASGGFEMTCCRISHHTQKRKGPTEKAGRVYGVNAGLAFRTKPKSVKNRQSGPKLFFCLDFFGPFCIKTNCEAILSTLKNKQPAKNGLASRLPAGQAGQMSGKNTK